MGRTTISDSTRRRAETITFWEIMLVCWWMIVIWRLRELVCALHVAFNSVALCLCRHTFGRVQQAARVVVALQTLSHFINASATAEPYIMVCVAGLVGFWWIVKNLTLSKSSLPASVTLSRSLQIRFIYGWKRVSAAIQKQFWRNSIGIFFTHSVELFYQVRSSEAHAITVETSHYFRNLRIYIQSHNKWKILHPTGNRTKKKKHSFQWDNFVFVESGKRWTHFVVSLLPRSKVIKSFDFDLMHVPWASNDVGPHRKLFRCLDSDAARNYSVQNCWVPNFAAKTSQTRTLALSWMPSCALLRHWQRFRCSLWAAPTLRQRLTSFDPINRKHRQHANKPTTQKSRITF